MSKHWNTSGVGAADWIWASLKQNSEGLLFLAAGCALLLRSGQSIGRTETYRSDAQEYLGDGQSALDKMAHQSTIHGSANEESRTADNAREHASSVGQKMRETAADYAASVGEYAHGTKEKVVGQSRRLAQKAQSRSRNFIQEQPVAIALAGLAVGVALAAALPVTTSERRVLAPARHRLSEAAESAGEKISDASVAAGERLIRGVAEHAIRAGLEELAGEPAHPAEQQQNSRLNVGGAGSSTDKSGTEQLTADAQRQGEESSEVGTAAKPVLDAQQKAVDDIRAGRAGAVLLHCTRIERFGEQYGCESQ